MNKIILIGGGGHCRSCIDVIEQEAVYEVSGILDKNHLVGKTVSGYTISGTDADIPSLASQGFFFLITVGQVLSPADRIRLYRLLESCNARLATIISPRAYVSKNAQVGNGTIIMHDALVNSGSSVGKNCIINTKALIEHDSVIEDHCHISTGAIVNGGVTVKTGTFFGSNAVSNGYVATSANDFVKAGSVFKGVKT